MIKKDTIIGEAISEYPQLAEFLFDLGFMCVGCSAAQFETLEQGLKVHGKTDKEIEEIIKKLNKLIK